MTEYGAPLATGAAKTKLAVGGENEGVVRVVLENGAPGQPGDGAAQGVDVGDAQHTDVDDSLVGDDAGAIAHCARLPGRGRLGRYGDRIGLPAGVRRGESESATRGDGHAVPQVVLAGRGRNRRARPTVPEREKVSLGADDLDVGHVGRANGARVSPVRTQVLPWRERLGGKGDRVARLIHERGREGKPAVAGDGEPQARR